MVQGHGKVEEVHLSNFVSRQQQNEDEDLILPGRNLSRYFPACQRISNQQRQIEIMAGPELASLNSYHSFIRRGIWDDSAGDQHGNCHLAELG